MENEATGGTEEALARYVHWIEQYGFHRLVGLKIDHVRPGYCQVSVRVRPELLNPFDAVHGSVLFTLADVAFGVACNAEGRRAVTLSANIQFTAPGQNGDLLTATARQVASGGRTAHYQVEICRQDGVILALFTGIMARRDELNPFSWPSEPMPGPSSSTSDNGNGTHGRKP